MVNKGQFCNCCGTTWNNLKSAVQNHGKGIRVIDGKIYEEQTVQLSKNRSQTTTHVSTRNGILTVIQNHKA